MGALGKEEKPWSIQSPRVRAECSQGPYVPVRVTCLLWTYLHEVHVAVTSVLIDSIKAFGGF